MFYTNVAALSNKILIRCVDKEGKKKKLKLNYEPTLYVPGKQLKQYTSLYGEPLDEISFESISAARDFLKKYEDIPNFKIYGMNRFDYAFISEVFPEEIEADFSKVTIAYLDIEVSSENGFPKPEFAYEPLTAITVHVNDMFHVFALRHFRPTSDDVVFHQYDSELEMVNGFLDVWVANMPDIATGWSSNRFDFPYLINRMKRLGLEDKQIGRLSPWGMISDRDQYVKGSDKIEPGYGILGVALIDYLDLYKKFSAHPNQPSYKLGEIGNVELGIRKVDYSQYGSLSNLYKQNHQLYIEYNIGDVDIVRKLEGKTKLLELAMTLAFDSKVNFEDVFYQVRMWDSIIYNHLKKQNIIIPPKRKISKSMQYAGAYVKEPKPGDYKWVVSFDLTSLYPHLIMMYNISPERLVTNQVAFNTDNITVDALLDKKIDLNPLKDLKVTVTPNKQLFSIEKKGFLSELMDAMYEDRARYKKLMMEAKKEKQTTTDPTKLLELDNKISRYQNLQQAKKVSLNSAYGTIGNNYFRFFDVRIAEAVTMSGQLSARWIETRINKMLNELNGKTGKDYVIASDTDSIYLTLADYIDPLVAANGWTNEQAIDEMNKLCEKTIQPFIDGSYTELADYVNAYAQKMIMKREALASRGIWTAKKHYLLKVYDNEGIRYKEPEVKVVGLEGIKSSTPNASRKKLMDSYKMIFNNTEDELRAFVKAFRTEFPTLPLTEIGKPITVNGLGKYGDEKDIYGFKTPAHTKGALIFNHYLREMDLTKLYEEIKEGEKIKYIHLMMPNPLQSPVISFTSVIPNEFALTNYIDYNEQFEKSFIAPLTPILKAIGWTLRKVSNLDRFVVQE